MSTYYYNQGMNESQVRADKIGKAATYKYLTQAYQHTIGLFDTDHKSQQCRVDFVAFFANGFANYIEVKSRVDVSSTSYATTFISAAKIQYLYNLSEEMKGKNLNNLAFAFVYFNDGELYKFDVAKIYKELAPVYRRVRKSHLGLGDFNMKDELMYEIDIKQYGFRCGNYQIQDSELLPYFDWNLDRFGVKI